MAHSAPVAAAPPAPAVDRLVYAVGDIHGRLDLLHALTASILTDALATRPARKPLLICLGDYIDRGPDSAGVVEFLIGLAANPAIDLTLLKGNHEQTLLDFLTDPGIGPDWMSFGGGATLISYGVSPPALTASPSAWKTVRDALALALPASHLQFLQRLQLVARVGDYVFVHAGLRPGTAIENQRVEDLLWIREGFLDAREGFEAIVVHGHSASAQPEHTSSRIGIDTGAYATNVLTALRLEGETREILQTTIGREAPHAYGIAGSRTAPRASRDVASRSGA